jgi:hypothetical protein
VVQAGGGAATTGAGGGPAPLILKPQRQLESDLRGAAKLSNKSIRNATNQFRTACIPGITHSFCRREISVDTHFVKTR